METNKFVKTEWSWRWRAFRSPGDYSRHPELIVVWRYVYAPFYSVGGE